MMIGRSNRNDVALFFDSKEDAQAVVVALGDYIAAVAGTGRVPESEAGWILLDTLRRLTLARTASLDEQPKNSSRAGAQGERRNIVN
jgi:hypothetical protein